MDKGAARTRFHITERALMVLTGVITGVFTGCIAAALKQLVSLVNNLCLSQIDLAGDVPHWPILLYPLLGVCLTAIFQKYIIGYQCARGTYLIRRHISAKNADISPFMIFDPMIGCSVTIGTGASGGTEGPVALCGSAIGTRVAGMLRLSPEWRRLTMVIGAGAGIAAIFKAPMGGVLFVLEVLEVEFSTVPVIALILACILACATAQMCSNFTLDIDLLMSMKIDLSLMGWVALLGLVAGLYSIYFNYTKTRTAIFFLGMKRRWIAAVATGLMLSLAAFLFPALFSTGMGVVEDLINNRHANFLGGGLFTAAEGRFAWAMGACLCMLLLKGALVGAAYSGGGVSGDFMPTLFAGALLGYLFSAGLNHLFGLSLPTWYFCLMGMAAVMAGSVNAPLMAMMILCETTDTSGYLLAYLVAVGVCYATVRIGMPAILRDDPERHDSLLARVWENTPSLRTSDKTPPDQTPL